MVVSHPPKSLRHKDSHGVEGEIIESNFDLTGLMFNFQLSMRL